MLYYCNLIIYLNLLTISKFDIILRFIINHKIYQIILFINLLSYFFYI